MTEGAYIIASHVQFGMRKRKSRGKLLVRNSKGLSASFFFILLLVVSAFGWQFGEDCVLKGTVTFFGDSNRSDLSVEAFIGDLKVAKTAVTS